MKVFFLVCALCFVFSSAVSAQSACPVIQTQTVLCSDGQGCNGSVAVPNCSSHMGAQQKCVIPSSGFNYSVCCGQAVYWAYAGDPCDGPTGYIRKQLAELSSAPISVQRRVYAPTCSNGFRAIRS
jgi:hypothetical protein